jgi:hypothetical protein
MPTPPKRHAVSVSSSTCVPIRSFASLVIVNRRRKERHKRSVPGRPVRSSHSLKNARIQREPWLLVVCPELAHLGAKAVVSVYAKRMQIEEEFRDLKSPHFGLGLSASRSRNRKQLSVLLLIACLATFVLRLIGEIAHARQIERQYQRRAGLGGAARASAGVPVYAPRGTNS